MLIPLMVNVKKVHLVACCFFNQLTKKQDIILVSSNKYNNQIYDVSRNRRQTRYYGVSSNNQKE